MVFIAPPFLSDAFLLPLLLPLPYGTIVKNVVSKKTDSKQGKGGKRRKFHKKNFMLIGEMSYIITFIAA